MTEDLGEGNPPGGLPTPAEDEPAPSEVTRRWWVFWAKWYAVPAVLGLLAVVVAAVVFYIAGARPVIAGVLLAVVPCVAVWVAIRVYFNHIFTVYKPRGSERLQIAAYAVPLELWREVRIKGGTAMAEDQYGRELHICRTFDPVTLEGESPWSGNLTPLHFAARWELAEDIIRDARTNILKYGEGGIRAARDFLINHDKVARYADRILKLNEVEDSIRSEDD